MRKYIVWFIIIVIVLGAAGYFIFVNRDMLKTLPTKNTFSFEYLSCVVSDSSGNIYTIDQSRKRIVKMDQSGAVRYIINDVSREDESLYLAMDMAADDDGYLYVLNTILDSQGYYVNSEEIVRYTPAGEFEKAIYRVDYPEGAKPVRTGLLMNLKLREGTLYFYSTEESGFSLKSLGTEGGNAGEVLSFWLPPEVYLTDIAGTEEGSIYFSTKKGRIFKADESGKPVQVYPDEEKDLLPLSLPVYLDVSGQGQLCFADIGAREISCIDRESGMVEGPLFSGPGLAKHGYDIPMPVITYFGAREDGSLIVAASDRVIYVGTDGRVEAVIEKAIYSQEMLLLRWIIWALALLMLILIFIAWKIMYFNIMRRRVSMILKQVVIFVPVIMVSTLLVSGIVYNNLLSKFEEEVGNKLKLLAHSGSQIIRIDHLERITRPSHFMNDDYKAVRENVHYMLEGSPAIDSSALYGAVYKVDGGKLYVCMFYDDSASPYYPYDYSEGDYYSSVMQTGEIVLGRSSDADGDWMYAIAPLHNKDGKLIGLFETGMDMNGFEQYKQSLFINTGKVAAAVTGVVILIFLIMTYYLLLPIRILRNGVSEVASGNWDTVVSVKTRDEGAELCKGFNTMSEYIRGYISKITMMSESYYRFVPQQFVTFLGKESIIDVQLGDNIKQEMCVLFLSIRSFFTFSEMLTPEENFNFINSFLKRIGPVIRNNNGFVDSYLGAGVLALFPGGAEDAVKAAIHMRSELQHYNSHRKKSGYAAVDIGIGIHMGPLMLGIIGEERRIAGTVISDNVNLAETLEELSARLGASILITGNTLQSMAVPGRFQHRFAGLVRVEGKEEPVLVHDIYQGDNEEIRLAKAETKDLFEEGIMLYRDGRFYDARARFVEVVKRNRQDEAAKRYFYLCDEYYKVGAPEGWNGELSF